MARFRVCTFGWFRVFERVLLSVRPCTCVHVLVCLCVYMCVLYVLYERGLMHTCLCMCVRVRVRICVSVRVYALAGVHVGLEACRVPVRKFVGWFIKA